VSCAHKFVEIGKFREESKTTWVEWCTECGALKKHIGFHSIGESYREVRLPNNQKETT